MTRLDKKIKWAVGNNKKMNILTGIGAFVIIIVVIGFYYLVYC